MAEGPRYEHLSRKQDDIPAATPASSGRVHGVEPQPRRKLGTLVGLAAGPNQQPLAVDGFTVLNTSR
jgi:hypothetical protein